MGVKRSIVKAILAVVDSGSGAETISGSFTFKKRGTARTLPGGGLAHKAVGVFRKAIVIERGRDATADFLIPIVELPAAAATR